MKDFNPRLLIRLTALDADKREADRKRQSIHAKLDQLRFEAELKEHKAGQPLPTPPQLVAW